MNAHEATMLVAALIFCAAQSVLILTLCKIGEKNRQKELADLWGG